MGNRREANIYDATSRNLKATDSHFMSYRLRSFSAVVHPPIIAIETQRLHLPHVSDLQRFIPSSPVGTLLEHISQFRRSRHGPGPLNKVPRALRQM